MSSKLTFGERLADLRNLRGLTQEDIAKLVKKTPQNVGHYETNKAFPPRETLIILADFFHVSVDYLMARTDFDLRSEHLERTFTEYAGRKVSAGWLLDRLFSLDDDSRRELLELVDVLIRGGKLKVSKK